MVPLPFLALAAVLQAPGVEPIGAVRADADGDGVPDRAGQAVTVAGRATTSLRDLNADYLRLYVQDGTGGIQLFGREFGPRVEAGDSVVATGVVGQYQGQTQLRIQRYRVVPGARRLPAAVDVPVDAADLESYEGRLGRVRGRVLRTGSNAGGRFLVVGPADGSEPGVTVFAADDGAPVGLDRFTVGDEVAVTGPVGQYAFEPFEGGYQLYPRSPDDVRAVGLTRVGQRRLIGAIALALALALGGGLLLRRQAGRRMSELERTEQRLDLLLNQMPAVLWTVDRDLRFGYARGTGLEALGDAPDSNVGVTLFQYFGTDDPDFPPIAAHRRALEGQAVAYDFEWRGRTFETQLQPLRESDGAIVGVIGVAFDATERKRSEAALARSLSLVRATLESTADGILVVDRERRVVDHNRKFLEMWRIPPDVAATGDDGRLLEAVIDQVADPDGFLARIRELYDAVERESDDLIELRDGRVFERYSQPHRLGDEIVGRVWSFRDITDRVRTERALVEREEQFLQAQKMEAVGRLAGGIAHDFNNLLTAIRGNTEFLIADLPEGDPLREDVGEIVTAADRAAALTRQLLAFSRKQILMPVRLDLNEVVHGMAKLLQRVIGEDIVLRTDLEPAAGTIEADRGQIEQVIMNLAVNSRDAMPQGGRLTIRTDSVHRGQPPRDFVRLSVADTGDGMDEATRERIFEPFFTTKETGRGTGLGLATVYGIVKQSGGEIEVESTDGLGTTFRIYLPVAEAEEEEDAEPDSPPEPSAAPESGGGEVVLLVEDEQGVRQMARRALERRGYVVLEARSGAEALRVAREHEGAIDLVVTDVVMPGMGGAALAEALRRLRPSIDVLFTSGYTDDDLFRRGHAALDGHFLEKPFSPDALAWRVRELLDARAASEGTT